MKIKSTRLVRNKGIVILFEEIIDQNTIFVVGSTENAENV